MINFLFWNINNKDLRENICRIVVDHRIDVVILAESNCLEVDMETALRGAVADDYFFCPGTCRRIQVYTSFAFENVEVLEEADHYSTRNITLPSGVDILLASAHLPSKLHAGDMTQALNCRDLAEVIRDVEKNVVQHERTLLVGDLNMNPFEEGIVAARLLNAVLSREIARKGFRKYKGKTYPYFYNPMWAFLNDYPPSPSGSYFYPDSGNDVCYYWNVFDQVLVRPSLLDHFRQGSLRILDTDGQVDLLSRGKGVRRPQPSDHLPITFALDL